MEHVTWFDPIAVQTYFGAASSLMGKMQMAVGLGPLSMGART